MGRNENLSENDKEENEKKLYAISEAAHKNALLDVIGTASLLVLSLILIATAARVFAVGSSMTLGIGVLIGGLLLAAAAFDLLPLFRN